MEGACENLIPAIEIHSKVGGGLPVPKDASSTVASDGDILANDLALLPFVVGREYFGYADLGRTLFPGDGVVVAAAVLHGLREQIYFSHCGSYKNKGVKFININS